jgi:sulfur relay (sulfurtransferase) DsrC/TusE family protein
MEFEMDPESLPDVQEYFGTLNAAEEKRTKDYAEYQRNCSDSTASSRYFELNEEHYRVVREAWDKLKTSSNPLIQWIANNCGKYKQEAHEALMALRPNTTLADLDEIAHEHSWCDVWDGFRERIIAERLLGPSIRMRTGNGYWQDFSAYELPSGAKLTPDMIGQFLDHGVKSLTLNTDAGTLYFKLAA